MSYNEIYKAYDWSNLSTMSSPCDWRAVEAYLIDMMGVWGRPLEEGSRDPNIDQGTDWEVLLGFWGHLFTGIQQVLGELTERRKHWNNYCHTFHSSSEHNTMKLHCIICIIFSFASVFLVQYEPNQKQNVNFCVTCLKGQEVVLKWCVNWFFTQQHHNEQSIVWEYTQTHNILQMARSTT